MPMKRSQPAVSRVHNLNAIPDYCLDEPMDFAGAPLCLQLVSRRFADETVVQGLYKIAEVLPLE